MKERRSHKTFEAENGEGDVDIFFILSFYGAHKRSAAINVVKLPHMKLPIISS